MKKAETACSDIMEEEGSSSQQNNSNSAIQLKILKNTKNQTSMSDSEDHLTKVRKSSGFLKKTQKFHEISQLSCHLLCELNVKDKSTGRFRQIFKGLLENLNCK